MSRRLFPHHGIAIHLRRSERVNRLLHRLDRCKKLREALLFLSGDCRKQKVSPRFWGRTAAKRAVVDHKHRRAITLRFLVRKLVLRCPLVEDNRTCRIIRRGLKITARAREIGHGRMSSSVAALEQITSVSIAFSREKRTPLFYKAVGRTARPFPKNHHQKDGRRNDHEDGKIHWVRQRARRSHEIEPGCFCIFSLKDHDRHRPAANPRVLIGEVLVSECRQPSGDCRGDDDGKVGRPQPELKPATEWVLRPSGIGFLIHGNNSLDRDTMKRRADQNTAHDSPDDAHRDELELHGKPKWRRRDMGCFIK